MHLNLQIIKNCQTPAQRLRVLRTFLISLSRDRRKCCVTKCGAFGAHFSPLFADLFYLLPALKRFLNVASNGSLQKKIIHLWLYRNLNWVVGPEKTRAYFQTLLLTLWLAEHLNEILGHVASYQLKRARKRRKLSCEWSGKVHCEGVT